MSFDKKPSMYSEHGTIGSAEELDAYGVWVKSEPQDFSAGLAEAVNFDSEAIPYEADYETDFDTGFNDLEIGDIGLPDYEPEIPELSEIDSEDSAPDDFDDGIISEAGRRNEDASNKLLLKIAEELSMIRSELSTLKKEFAGIRVNAPDVKTDASHSGFFTEEDDEKIALTGDEMEDILSSTADYSGEEDLDYDPLREADEAALKELAEQNERFASEDDIPAEEINIDFNNLGINLDNELEAETETALQEELPPLEATDDDFAIPSFDSLSFDETPELETESQLEEAINDFADELVPFEEDEELRDIRLEGAIPLTPPPDNTSYLEEDPFALDDASLEETSIEDTVHEEGVSEKIVSGEPVHEETISEEPVLEEATSQEAVPADSFSVEDTPDLSFDDVSFDLDFDDFSDDSSLSFDDEADTQSVDIQSEDIESVDIQSEDIQSADIQSGDDQVPAESPAPPADLPSDDISLDLSEAVIDEPDFSAEIVEPPLEEPVLGDISFKDDISLDMDDFGAAEPVKTGEKVDAFDADDSLAQVIPEGFEVNAEEAATSFDDDLEVFADDDLPLTAEEIIPLDAPVSEPGGAEDHNLPSGLKNELKSVLSYMDHLLESLPEDKIEEFAKSEYFDTYKKIFKELGLV